jgi:UDP-glucuronate decarboxylase
MPSIPQLKHLEGSSLLITGGSGFLGRAILSFLNNNSVSVPNEIYILSRGRKMFNHQEWRRLNIKLINSDINEIESLPSPIDYIIHAATSTELHESLDFKYLMQTILSGTQRILKLSEDKKLKHFIYVSSGAVYGLHHTKPVALHESCDAAPLVQCPTEYYGHFKRMAELYVAEFQKRENIPTTIGRLFAFSGEDLSPKAPFALVQFLRQALAQKRILLSGDGTAMRSYMDQEDLAFWILDLLKGAEGLEIINIGSDQEITTGDLARKIAMHVGECSVEMSHASVGRSNYYVPVIDKAKKQHGLGLERTLDQSLSKMILSKRFEC